MKLMMIMNATLNITMLMMKHPLSMGVIIIMQAALISLMTGMMYKSFWFSYILFLMFVGGMMILFMYMTSLVPNMMFSMSMKIIIMIILAVMITLFIWNEESFMNEDMLNNNKLILMKMYSNPINLTIIMLMSYLLFTMITVFKITELNKGPLRLMYN